MSVAAPRVSRVTLDKVQSRYRELNGDHVMTPEDDAYVRSCFVEVAGGAGLAREEVLDLMADGRLPLPSYLLSDGTPMVHPDFLAPVAAAGSVEALHDWFVGQWPDEQREVAEEEWGEGYLSGQYVCLWSVTPDTIQGKTAAIEDIKAAMSALQAGAGSRGELAEAVDRLDALEPPFAGYDLRRFGGPTSRQVWIDDVRRDHLAGVSEPG